MTSFRKWFGAAYPGVPVRPGADTETFRPTKTKHPTGPAPEDPHPGPDAPFGELIDWYCRNVRAGRIPPKLPWSQVQSGKF